MLIYILAILALLLLGLLYYKVGSHKTVFLGFTFTILLAGGIVYFAWPRPQDQTENQALTEAQRYELMQQQQVFAAWYEEYQKNLAELDRNWQWYHHILESFKAGNISLQTVHMRLMQLEQDSAQLKARFASHPAPLELNSYCYDLVNSVCTKTMNYADAQSRTITLTRAAADPARIQTEDPHEQSRLLQTVMLRESPAALFTATEIKALREQLASPKEEKARTEEN